MKVKAVSFGMFPPKTRGAVIVPWRRDVVDDAHHELSPDIYHVGSVLKMSGACAFANCAKIEYTYSVRQD